MITATRLLNRVRALGTKEPMRVAECKYVDVDTKQPCCIVGHALLAQGAPVDPFLEDDDLNRFTNVMELFECYSDRFNLVNDSGSALATLVEIQKAQDEAATTWGAAVAQSLR